MTHERLTLLGLKVEVEAMLRLAGFLSSAIALLHIGIILLGAPAYRYFGAGEEMAAEQGLSRRGDRGVAQLGQGRSLTSCSNPRGA